MINNNMDQAKVGLNLLVAQKVRELRRDLKYNQEEIATRMGISIAAFSMIEAGETNINISRLEQLAHIFGISMAQLVNGKNPVVFTNKNPEMEQRLFDWETRSYELRR